MRNDLVPLALLVLLFSQIAGYSQTAKRGAEDGASGKSGGSAKRDVLVEGRNASGDHFKGRRCGDALS